MNYYRHHRSRLLIFTVLSMVIFGVPLQAQALTLSPSRIEVAGDPGSTITKTVLIVNETESTETYYTSYANFEAQGDSGTPVFVDPTGDLGTWMSIPSSVTLAAGESREVDLAIAIPSNAESGGHFAAVFWGTTPPSREGAVSVGSKTGLLVLLSVTGEVKEAMGLVDFHTAGKKWFYKKLPVGFEYRFSNQGGDRVKPIGTITVRSLLGWTVKKIDANPSEGNVLPSTTRKFTPEWSKRDSVEDAGRSAGEKYSFGRAVKDEWHNFAIGIFRARLATEFGTEAQRTKSASVYFVVFPWELLIVLVPGAYIVWKLLRFALRRYNRAIIRRAQRNLSKEHGL